MGEPRRPFPAITADQLQALHNKMQDLERLLYEVQRHGERKFDAVDSLLHQVEKLAERNGHAITVIERTLAAVERLTQECHAAIYVRVDSEPGMRTQLLLFREALEGFQETLRTVRHQLQDDTQSLNKRLSDLSAVREQGVTQLNVTKLTVLGNLITLIASCLLSYFLLSGAPTGKGGVDGPPPPPTSKTR